MLQANPSALMTHITIFGPALAECLKDGNTPVRLAAERCALHAFQLTKGIYFCCMHIFFNFTFLLVSLTCGYFNIQIFACHLG